MAILPHKKQLVEALGDLSNAVILDYGCGMGDFIELILAQSPGCQSILAVDSSAAMINKIKIRFNDELKTDKVACHICTSPSELVNQKFDRIICHNVLECVDDKIAFINAFQSLLDVNGMMLLSHHDFDSAIYHSAFIELTRNLIHHFADTKQDWQLYCDGQMGRKIPGLIQKSVFKNSSKCYTFRIVERDFAPGTYGHLMADMLTESVKAIASEDELQAWRKDLSSKSQQGSYYFAIDLVVAKIRCTRIDGENHT